MTRRTGSKGALNRLFGAPVHLYRWKYGWLLGRRFLLLNHTGRRTGLRRHTVLEVLEYRENGPEAVVMSAFGPEASWLRNIEATPDAEVVIGARRFAAAHRFLDIEEAAEVIARYERRNRLLAPIIRAVLSHLLGWHYRSSTEDRQRLVSQLPLVTFRPRD
jgi:deazaflavin-dependent oxidoreductase (nitroreductase family)